MINYTNFIIVHSDPFSSSVQSLGFLFHFMRRERRVKLLEKELDERFSRSVETAVVEYLCLVPCDADGPRGDAMDISSVGFVALESHPTNRRAT